MNIKPVFTEKSMNMAKNGIYTFLVLPALNKNQIKQAIAQTFEVKVDSVKTVNYKKEAKKNWKGKRVTRQALKKAYVTLKGKDKIDIFESEKK